MQGNKLMDTKVFFFFIFWGGTSDEVETENTFVF